jgi:hypothetical protein
MPNALPPGAYRADLAVINPLSTAVAGETRVLRVALRNLGAAVWRDGANADPGAVTLGAHLHRPDGSLVTETLPRVALPYDVPPGAGLTMSLPLPLDAALAAGVYTVYIDLVLEGFGWFAALGGAGTAPVAMPITVQAAHGEPCSPLVAIAGRALGELGLRAPSAALLEPVARVLVGLAARSAGAAESAGAAGSPVSAPAEERHR